MAVDGRGQTKVRTLQLWALELPASLSALSISPRAATGSEYAAASSSPRSPRQPNGSPPTHSSARPQSSAQSAGHSGEHLNSPRRSEQRPATPNSPARAYTIRAARPDIVGLFSVPRSSSASGHTTPRALVHVTDSAAPHTPARPHSAALSARAARPGRPATSAGRFMTLPGAMEQASPQVAPVAAAAHVTHCYSAPSSPAWHAGRQGGSHPCSLVRAPLSARQHGLIVPPVSRLYTPLHSPSPRRHEACMLGVQSAITATPTTPCTYSTPSRREQPASHDNAQLQACDAYQATGHEPVLSGSIPQDQAAAAGAQPEQQGPTAQKDTCSSSSHSASDNHSCDVTDHSSQNSQPGHEKPVCQPVIYECNASQCEDGCGLPVQSPASAAELTSSCQPALPQQPDQPEQPQQLDAATATQAVAEPLACGCSAGPADTSAPAAADTQTPSEQDAGSPPQLQQHAVSAAQPQPAAGTESEASCSSLYSHSTDNTDPNPHLNSHIPHSADPCFDCPSAQPCKQSGYSKLTVSVAKDERGLSHASQGGVGGHMVAGGQGVSPWAKSPGEVTRRRDKEFCAYLGKDYESPKAQHPPHTNTHVPPHHPTTSHPLADHTRSLSQRLNPHPATSTITPGHRRTQARPVSASTASQNRPTQRSSQANSQAWGMSSRPYSAQSAAGSYRLSMCGHDSSRGSVGHVGGGPADQPLPGMALGMCGVVCGQVEARLMGRTLEAPPRIVRPELYQQVLMAADGRDGTGPGLGSVPQHMLNSLSTANVTVDPSAPIPGDTALKLEGPEKKIPDVYTTPPHLLLGSLNSPRQGTDHMYWQELQGIPSKLWCVGGQFADTPPQNLDSADDNVQAYRRPL